MSKVRTAAESIVEAILGWGVERVFCVPGESYLDVLDALYARRDEIEVVVCRHEAGAAHMAEAHGKMTGRPGVCFVTRGPGAFHGAIGVHTARQDSTPMVLFIGQVGLADRGREAFQEFSTAAAFGPIAKHAEDLDRADRTPEVLARAYVQAMQGRRGPVVIGLPEDVLDQPCAQAPRTPAPAVAAGLDPAALGEIAARLEAAARPLFILGGGDWTAEAGARFQAFAEAHGLPIALSFRRKSLINNASPSYAGDLGLGPNPALVARVREADLVIALGARLSENATQGYSLFTPEETAAKLIHIHPDPEEIGRVWPVALGAVANAAAGAGALAGLTLTKRWSAWAEGAHPAYLAWTRPTPTIGAVNPSEVFAHLSAALPDDAVIANGAGNFAAWLHRFYRHRGFLTQLAPTSGAMGYAIPAAIAAKLARPQAEAFAVCGDGDAMMSIQELATAVQANAAIRVLVLDNSSFGTIRMHQERRFPDRVSATTLKNPDFAALARACGFWAQRVERTEAFPAALAEARAQDGPALLHLVTDVEDISPGRTLGALRAAG